MTTNRQFRQKCLTFVRNNFPDVAEEYIREAENMDGVEYWVNYFKEKADWKKALTDDIRLYLQYSNEKIQD